MYKFTSSTANKNECHLQTPQCIQTTASVSTNIFNSCDNSPRVAFHDMVQLCTYDSQVDTPLAQTLPTKLIVESYLAHAADTDFSNNSRSDANTSDISLSVTNHSIVSVTQWQCTPPAPTTDSIAACLMACYHETAHTIIDMETGQALEYHQLLHHLNFKDAWNHFAINQFSCLAKRVRRPT